MVVPLTVTPTVVSTATLSVSAESTETVVATTIPGA